MMRSPLVACSFLVCLAACSTTREAEPTGLIARFGSTPTIDGVFDSGEWDDAEIARVDSVEQFMIKHDGTNLYFAIKAGGGELWFDTDAGLRVLHWSAQLGSAEYTKTDTSTQSLDKPFAFELWGLQEESPLVIQETLAGYLAEHGWAANTAAMGDLMQSELVVSFEWLGIDTESGRFKEIPGVRIRGGLMVVRGDPRAQALMALSREEMMRQYPPVTWPATTSPDDAMGMGGLPDTIQVDSAEFGRIWIDLQGPGRGGPGDS